MIRAKRPLLLGNSREGPTRPALHRQAVPSVAQQNADLATSHLLLPAVRRGGVGGISFLLLWGWCVAAGGGMFAAAGFCALSVLPKNPLLQKD